MIRKIIFLVLVLITTVSLYPINYITTAESISWNGAYTSVADGFEAMLYNPAGLYYTNARYGLNLFGSYGVRIFNNSVSSDQVINILLAASQTPTGNITSIQQSILSTMPVTGFDVGFDVSVMPVMSYFRFSKWSLGLSFVPKTSGTVTMSKSFFTAMTDLDLSSPVQFGISSTISQYMDMSFILSTRAGFLEKVIPVEAIYVGMTGHFYLPTFYMNMKTNEGSIETFVADPITGLMGQRVNLDVTLSMSAANMITESINATGSTALLSQQVQAAGLPGFDFAPIFSYAGAFGFGIGFDFGAMVKFNRFVRLGFSVTDLGFIVYPSTADYRIQSSHDLSVDYTTFDFTAYQNLGTALQGDLTGALGGTPTKGATTWFMPDTSFRVGVAVTPLKNGWFTWATDISLSDMNRIINGETPTFNFSTGVEFAPGVKWFSFPMRFAFNYNSQSNSASFSMGLGLYLGPVEMEFAVRGLEFLITGWGAKEAQVGVDFKFEF
jgi:hypothetical protein